MVKIPFYTRHNFKWKINKKKKLHKSLNNSGTITPENMKFSLSYLFLLSTFVGTLKTGRKFIQSNLLQKVCPWVITLNSYPEYILFSVDGFETILTKCWVINQWIDGTYRKFKKRLKYSQQFLGIFADNNYTKKKYHYTEYCLAQLHNKLLR